MKCVRTTEEVSPPLSLPVCVTEDEREGTTMTRLKWLHGCQLHLYLSSNPSFYVPSSFSSLFSWCRSVDMSPEGYYEDQNGCSLKKKLRVSLRKKRKIFPGFLFLFFFYCCLRISQFVLMMVFCLKPFQTYSSSAPSSDLYEFILPPIMSNHSLILQYLLVILS